VGGQIHLVEKPLPPRPGMRAEATVEIDSRREIPAIAILTDPQVIRISKYRHATLGNLPLGCDAAFHVCPPFCPGDRARS